MDFPISSKTSEIQSLDYLTSYTKSESSTFYEIPNHFPTLTKGGFSQ